jgi:8-oxo-dGTP pyrophosphatase MutT (NUDIX family)
MQWTIHGRRAVYRSEWAELWLDDVEIPDGPRFEHHVVRFSKTCVTAVCLDDAREHVLMLWRHRFITDRWGWELPAGWCEPDEDPDAAVRREVLEETGWRAGDVQVMTAYDAANGITDLRYTAYLVTGLTRVGEPEDGSESSRIAWVPLADVPKLAAIGELQDGAALTALSYYLGIWRRPDT